MKVVNPITLDVKKTNVQKVIHANQGEGLDRKLVVTLVSGNDTIILDNENQSVQFVAKKPDGTTIYNATAIKDGKAILYLTTQTVAAVGDVDCQLEVVSTDEGSVASGVIYSAKFTIAVEEALYNAETITSSNEFTELIELIERAEKQVTVFTGEGTPSEDPDEYDNIKESDFYYDSTNKTYRYAKSVTTTIAWEGLIRATYFNEVISYINTNINAKADKATTYTKTEVDTALLTKADKSTTYTKTEVDTALSGKQDKLTAIHGLGMWEEDDNLNIGILLESGMDGNLINFVWDDEGERHLLSLHGNTVANNTNFKIALGSYVYTETEVDNLLAAKQALIDSSHKLSADLLSDGSTNKPSVWNAKQDALTAGNGIDITNNIISPKLVTGGNLLNVNSSGMYIYGSAITSDVGFQASMPYDTTIRQRLADTSVQNALSSKSYTDIELAKKQNTIDSTHKLDSDNVDDSESTNKFVSAAEKAAIGKEPKYELIKTIDISELSEPVSMIIIDEDEQGNSFAYDDIAIVFDSLLGSAQGKLQIQTRIDDSIFSNYIQSNVLQTTARNRYATFVRETSELQVFNLGGYSSNSSIYSGNFAYTDKIDEVRIITDSTFTSGTIKVYGKVKY